MQQLWVLLWRSSYADHPRRACQLAYDLLKCNHPNVRSGLLFIPTSTRGICFDISKIYITGGVRGRVVKCASTSLWSCECVGSSFYCWYNVFYLALDAGHTVWLSSLQEATATLARWLGEPWSTVQLSTQTVALDGDVIPSRGSSWVPWAYLGWSQHLKSLQCGGIHDWVQVEPGALSSRQLLLSQVEWWPVVSLGHEAQEQVRTALLEFSLESYCGRMAVQDLLAVTFFKEASTSCFCSSAKP